MRVLHVVHDFPPASLAGVEVLAHDLARAQRDRGDRVTVLHTERAPGRAQYALRDGELSGLAVVRMTQNYPYRSLRDTVDDPQAERRFTQVLRQVAPDVVHLHHLWGWSAGLPARAARQGVPAVMHLHDHWPVCPSGGQRLHPDGGICDDPDRAPCDACYARFRSREGPLERGALALARHLPRPLPPDLLHRSFAGAPGWARGALKRLNEVWPTAARRTSAGPDAAWRRQRLRAGLQDCARLVAPSAFLAGEAARWGVGAARVVVEPNGTAMDGAGTTTPPGVAEPTRPLALLFLGTAMAHKGAHVLAEAVATADAAVTLTIHGAEPSPAYRDALARGAPRVRLGGPLERGAVAGAIDRADAVCVPSLWPENAPLVLLEARARRRPVLASAIGGIGESARGQLLPAGDVDAWRSAIERWADDRDALAAAAEAVEPPRAIATLAARLDAIYRDVGADR